MDRTTLLLVFTTFIWAPAGFANSSVETLYQTLQKEVAQHKRHLQQTGLAERARGIAILPYQLAITPTPQYASLAHLSTTPVPVEVTAFDPQRKNTLITTDPNADTNKAEDLAQVLSYRLPPPLRHCLNQYPLRVFLGSKAEMQHFFFARGYQINYEFKVPSSVNYYFASNAYGEIEIILTGLVGYDNLVAQLITLKLANFPVDNIKIIGQINHFNELVAQDIQQFLTSMPQYKQTPQALIVTGCSLNDQVQSLLQQRFGNQLGEFKRFSGDILQASHASLSGHRCRGILLVDLKYGEVMQKVVEQLLQTQHIGYVFSSSAGGFIATTPAMPKPAIGTRIRVLQARHPTGELTQVKSMYSEVATRTHLQVPSIFLETYQWLQQARSLGQSVDVETFYILKAIAQHNQTASTKVQADCGYFVSDYVGERPLRTYHNVYKHYPQALNTFFNQLEQHG